MGLQIVRGPEELVAGQFYIRACINMYGHHWFEVLKVYGRPFRDASSRRCGLSSKIRTIYTARNDGQVNHYVDDLGAVRDEDNEDYALHICTKLFRFSHRAVSDLKGLKVREFYNKINGTFVHDTTWKAIVGQWEVNAKADRTYNGA